MPIFWSQINMDIDIFDGVREIVKKYLNPQDETRYILVVPHYVCGSKTM